MESQVVAKGSDLERTLKQHQQNPTSHIFSAEELSNVTNSSATNETTANIPGETIQFPKGNKSLGSSDDSSVRQRNVTGFSQLNNPQMKSATVSEQRNVKTSPLKSIDTLPVDKSITGSSLSPNLRRALVMIPIAAITACIAILALMHWLIPQLCPGDTPCELQNNLRRSLTLMLTYQRGPPPT